MTPKQTLTKLLSLCAEHGYNAVAIGMRHKAVPYSIECKDVVSDIIANPKNEGKAHINGWPAIWNIVRMVGFEMPCAHCHRCQIHNLPFRPQVWQIKCGEWVKIAEKSLDA